VIAEKIEQIQELDRQGLPISEILEAINSPKAREILKEYKDFLESKEEKN
jgi:DNA-binding transcriptional MerR regulator